MSFGGVRRVACAHGEAPMSGRPKAQLVLSKTEREQLEALTLRRKTGQALALRARIVLSCADGADNKVVAARQRVTQQTVSKWRARFVEHRLDGLLDTPRPGAPRTIDDARVDAVIAKDAAPRLCVISPPSRNQVPMGMEDRLTGSFAGVQADVEAGNFGEPLDQ